MAENVESSGPVMIVTVTRSAGADGAYVVMIETGDEVVREDGGPGLRILVNDCEVYAETPLRPYRGGHDRGAGACDFVVFDTDVVQDPAPRVYSKHRSDDGEWCQVSWCSAPEVATRCPAGCTASEVLVVDPA